MDVVTGLKIYEKNGVELNLAEVPEPLRICSHPIDSTFVIVEVEGARYAVVSDQLLKAVANAKNVTR